MPDKSIAQLADWRLRPLPTALKVYARHDSHALLRAWTHMKLKVCVLKLILSPNKHFGKH